MALGRSTYQRQSLSDDLDYIKELIETENVELVIVGIPVNMDGSKGFQANRATVFKQKLQEYLTVPVKAVDERLTSQEAERVMLDDDVGRKERRANRDQLAATLILQRYLDRPTNSEE